MKAILLFCIFTLCACSSSSKISGLNANAQSEKAFNQVDLTTELSMLPGILVQGEGRLAKINLPCGTNAAFVLDGQIEPNYRYVYDRVQASKLKSLRILTLSESLIYGVRGESSNMILVETE